MSLSAAFQDVAALVAGLRSRFQRFYGCCAGGESGAPHPPRCARRPCPGEARILSSAFGDPLRVELAFAIHALVGVRAEIVALGLQQVRR